MGNHIFKKVIETPVFPSLLLSKTIFFTEVRQSHCANKLTGKPDEMLRVTCDVKASHPRVVAILSAT